MLARGMVGLGEGVALPAMNNLVANNIPPARRSTALGGCFTGFHTGQTTNQSINQYVFPVLGGNWDPTMLCCTTHMCYACMVCQQMPHDETVHGNNISLPVLPSPSGSLQSLAVGHQSQEDRHHTHHTQSMLSTETQSREHIFGTEIQMLEQLWQAHGHKTLLSVSSWPSEAT